MSITGYYDGTAVRVSEPLAMNQKVIVIPIENDTDFVKTAAGGVPKNSKPALID